MLPDPPLLTELVVAELAAEEADPVELSLHPFPQLLQPVTRLILQHMIFMVRPYDWAHLTNGRPIVANEVPKGQNGFCSLGTAALAVTPTPMEKMQEAPSLLFTPHAMPAVIPTPTLRPMSITVPTTTPKLMAIPMARPTSP